MIPPGDAEVLEFERIRWKYQGRKEDAIRRRFGISRTRYYQRLQAIAATPAAAAYDPQMVARIHRKTTARRAVRTTGSGS